MAICGRCGAMYAGKGSVCPHCMGRPLSPPEIKAINAGEEGVQGSTLDLGLAMNRSDTESGAKPSRSGAITTVKNVAARTTGESVGRHTPLLGTESDAARERTSTELTDPLIGKTPLGQYRILQKIGEGTFGAVYIADQVQVGRKAVIKVLRQGLAGSELFVKRFRREATVLAALDHHHLVRLYNFGELENGQVFLAMEYGGDRTLADEIQLNGRLSVERALRITEQVCSALNEAHNRSVVHRDLKPPNIMLGRKAGQDWVKVVDVGIAKILDTTDVDDKQSKLTDSGVIIGTPAYFSPEQARGFQVDGRSDIYAMGCILYEMLSGRLPIEALSPNDYIRAHTVEPPIPLKSRGVHVPSIVEDIVNKALAKDPGKRFQTASEMAACAAEARRRLTSNGEKGRRFPVAPLVSVAASAAVVIAYWWWRDRPKANTVAPYMPTGNAPGPLSPPQIPAPDVAPSPSPIGPPKPPEGTLKPQPLPVPPVHPIKRSRRNPGDITRGTPPPAPRPSGQDPATNAPLVLGRLVLVSPNLRFFALDPSALKVVGRGAARFRSKEANWEIDADYTPIRNGIEVRLHFSPSAIAYRGDVPVGPSLQLLEDEPVQLELRSSDGSSALIVLKFVKATE